MVLYERNGDDIDRGLIGHWKLDDLKRVATDGIIAHYKMNDNAASTVVIDSKDGNTGTLNENTSIISVAGKINEALDFDGTTNVVTLSSGFTFGTSLISFFCWIHPDSRTTGGGWKGIIGGVRDSLSFGLNDDDGSLRLTKVGTLDMTDSTLIPALNEWSFVGFTLSGTELIYYLNGSSETHTITAVDFTEETNSLGVREPDAGATTHFFDGEIDDVRIYDRALSLAEVQTIYNSNSGTETTELFRDTVTAIDRANFNDGTITGVTNADGQNWKPSNSMSFDGVDDDVNTTLELGDLENNGELTYSLWFKYVSHENTGIMLGTVGGGATRNYMSINPSSNNTIFGFGDALAAVTTSNETKWHHYACSASFSPSSITKRIYFDGLKGSDVTTNRSSVSSEFFKIGNINANLVGGNIQNVRIYNRVLTQGEINKLYRLRK